MKCCVNDEQSPGYCHVGNSFYVFKKNIVLFHVFFTAFIWFISDKVAFCADTVYVSFISSLARFLSLPLAPILKSFITQKRRIALLRNIDNFAIRYFSIRSTKNMITHCDYSLIFLCTLANAAWIEFSTLYIFSTTFNYYC